MHLHMHTLIVLIRMCYYINYYIFNPYRGPYRVLARTDKSYRIQLDNREDWISIDRLKPAYLDVDDHNRDVVTRSGRTSRPPHRFDMSHPNRGGM